MSDKEKIIGLLSMLPELTTLSCREAYEIINSAEVQTAMFQNWDELRKPGGAQ